MELMRKASEQGGSPWKKVGVEAELKHQTDSSEDGQAKKQRAAVRRASYTGAAAATPGEPWVTH